MTVEISLFGLLLLLVLMQSFIVILLAWGWRVVVKNDSVEGMFGMVMASVVDIILVIGIIKGLST